MYHAYLFPFFSPNLNFMKNLSSQMKDLQREEHATKIERLKKIANKTWRGITSEYLHYFSGSILQKMKAVVDAEGG